MSLRRDAPPYRVGLKHELSDPRAFPLVLGIFEFRRQAEHWQIVGSGFGRTMRRDEVKAARLDGMIGNFYEDRWVSTLQEAGVAVVNTSTVHAHSPFPRVGNDDEATGRMGAEHLLSKGFAHLGFVQRRNTWYSQQRFEAFNATAEDAGRRCHTLAVGSHSHAADAIDDWLGRVPKPIGVMAVVDHIASLVADRALQLSLRVPDDVAILGVDNSPWDTQIAEVPLSSIARDGQRAGYLAAKTLDGLMADESPPPDQWIPPLGVVTRQSTDIVLADDPVVTNALTYIRHNFQHGLQVEDVAAAMEVSRSNLERRMKTSIGKTPKAAVWQAQVKHAEDLLINSDQTTQQIATHCGFARHAQLFSVFKRLTGLTPGQYRQQRARG